MKPNGIGVLIIQAWDRIIEYLMRGCRIVAIDSTTVDAERGVGMWAMMDSSIGGGRRFT